MRKENFSFPWNCIVKAIWSEFEQQQKRHGKCYNLVAKDTSISPTQCPSGLYCLAAVSYVATQSFLQEERDASIHIITGKRMPVRLVMRSLRVLTGKNLAWT